MLNINFKKIKRINIMKKSILVLACAAIFGYAANAQTQKTTTSNAKSTTTSTHMQAQSTTQSHPQTTSTAHTSAALKVPAAVESAFKSKYPNITAPAWSMKGSNYQARFRMTNEEMKADFDAAGKWVQTETRISSTTLPSSVQESIKKEFADYRTEDAYKLQTVSNPSGYSAKLVKGAERYEVVFGADGKVVSKTKV
jgi:hypothetical protein